MPTFRLCARTSFSQGVSQPEPLGDKDGDIFRALSPPPPIVPEIESFFRPNSPKILAPTSWHMVVVSTDVLDVCAELYDCGSSFFLQNFGERAVARALALGRPAVMH